MKKSNNKKEYNIILVIINKLIKYFLHNFVKRKIYNKVSKNYFI